MNRRGFLGLLGLGGAAAVALAKLPPEELDELAEPTRTIFLPPRKRVWDASDLKPGALIYTDTPPVFIPSLWADAIYRDVKRRSDVNTRLAVTLQGEWLALTQPHLVA